MKKTVISGALAVSLLLGSSVAAYAMSINPPSIANLGNMTGISLPEIKLPELDESVVDMSVYQQHGLSYNEEDSKYYYDGRVVGLFVDKEGRGITFLSQSGEVHIKAVRDSSGNLTGLTELSNSEYDAIVSEMENKVDDIKVQISNNFGEMKRLKDFKPDIQGNINPLELGQHINEVTEQLESHMSDLKAKMQRHIGEPLGE